MKRAIAFACCFCVAAGDSSSGRFWRQHAGGKHRVEPERLRGWWRPHSALARQCRLQLGHWLVSGRQRSDATVPGHSTFPIGVEFKIAMRSGVCLVVNVA